MAWGLFATLIIGLILTQIGGFIPGRIGELIIIIGKIASSLTGAGIGIGVATKFKSGTYVTVSSAICGMIGAFATKILARQIITETGGILLVGPGEPLGAFVAAFVGIEIGNLINGKTKVDIIIVPLVTILCGATVGLLIGPPISNLMTALRIIYKLVCR